MSHAKPPPNSDARFENSVPILRVRDLAASLDYYAKALGFHVDWEHPGGMASVSRGGAAVMLCQGDQGQPGTWAWMGVTDAAALFNEYTSTGASIRHAPRNYPWALEFQVVDLDGHVLRIGSEPLMGQPFDEWFEGD